MSGRPVPTFFETARKFIVALVGVAVLYGTIVGDVLGESDFTTLEGCVGGVIALATALGVYGVKNA
jgi:hypothetical protein